MKKNIKLRQMFIWMLVTITITPILVMGSYMLYYHVMDYMKGFDAGVYNNISTVSNYITNYDINNRRAINLFCEYPLIKSVDTNLQKNLIINTISEFERNYLETKHIGVGLSNGTFIAGSDVILESGFDPRNRIWYKQAMDSRNEIILTSSYKTAVKNETNTITYSKALRGKDNQIIGAVAFDINMDNINNAISDVNIGKDGFIVILDSNGKAFVNNNQNNYKSMSKDNTWIGKINYNGEKPTEITINHKKYMSYAIKNVGTNWKIIALITLKEYNSNIFSIIFIVITIMIVFILFSIVVSNYISNKLIEPYIKINDALKTTRDGDYSTRIDYDYKVPLEIKDIIDSINETIIKVETQTSDLEAQNEEIAAQNEEISSLYQQTSAMNGELNSLLDQIRDDYKQTVMVLANAIEAKDEYTKGHCVRVTQYAVKIAEKMNLRSDDVEKIEIAGLIHDIGKIGVPIEILNKNGKLTKEEYEIVKKHPSIGYNIIKDLTFLKDSAEILLQHHERVDGKGYPQGINGDKINNFAAILSVADSYDAMTSSRPYRTVPLTKEAAIEQLVINKGTQFKAEIVEVFVGILEEY